MWAPSLPGIRVLVNNYVQVGMAGSVIQAAVAATPAKPKPNFKPDFNRHQAYQYALLSQLAYKPYQTIESKVREYQLSATMKIYDSLTDTNGFVASNSSTLIVVFKGTSPTSPQNVLADLWLIYRKIISSKKPEILGHRGFVVVFNTVYASIKDHIKSDIRKKRLFIAGHSLGGALASLLTYRLTLDFPGIRPVMYVYGCPPVGNIKFSDYFKGMSTYSMILFPLV